MAKEKPITTVETQEETQYETGNEDEVNHSGTEQQQMEGSKSLSWRGTPEKSSVAILAQVIDLFSRVLRPNGTTDTVFTRYIGGDVVERSVSLGVPIGRDTVFSLEN